MRRGISGGQKKRLTTGLLKDYKKMQVWFSTLLVVMYSVLSFVLMQVSSWSDQQKFSTWTKSQLVLIVRRHFKLLST